MSLGLKIGLTVLVVLIGGVIFGVLQDTIGRGQYLAAGVEVIILFYIWTRKVPFADSKTGNAQGVGDVRLLRGIAPGIAPQSAVDNEARTQLNRPESADATDGSETEADLSDWKERYGAAFIAIEYRPDATEAWSELKSLPKKYREKFLEKLSAEPQGDIADIKSIILSEHQKEIAPFDDDEMNQALAEARKLGEMAEKEFLSVHEALGKSVTADHLIKMIREKYQIKKLWGQDITERGLIGGQEYYITDFESVFVKDSLEKFIKFDRMDEARIFFNIPFTEKKIPESGKYSGERPTIKDLGNSYAVGDQEFTHKSEAQRYLNSLLDQD